MSLNWDLSKVKNHREKCWVPDGKDDAGEQLFSLNGVTNGFIWLTLLVEMGEITEDNWKEFYMRCRLYETLRGQYFKGSTIKPEWVHDHIGLKTNVYGTKRDWNKRLAQYQQDFIKEASLTTKENQNGG